MRKYKEYYNYEKIIDIIQNDINIKSFLIKNKKQIMNLIKTKIELPDMRSSYREVF